MSLDAVRTRSGCGSAARAPAEDERRVHVARKAIGDDVELFVDANGAYSRTDARAWAECFAVHGVRYLEAPVGSHDSRACARSATTHGPAWPSPPASTATSCPGGRGSGRGRQAVHPRRWLDSHRTGRVAVFNENEVRAAAGVTLVIGAVAFSFAFFEQQYLPLQLASSFFLVEFVLRTTLGIRYSPVGVVARRLTRGQAPEWVSAKPKRFAWTFGVAMAGAMTVITTSGIRGTLPGTLCLICMTLIGWSLRLACAWGARSTPGSCVAGGRAATPRSWSAPAASARCRLGRPHPTQRPSGPSETPCAGSPCCRTS